MIIGIILITAIVFALCVVIKVINGENSETPNITYKLDDDLEIIRVQNGHDDLFPKYILYRKINGKWVKRAWTYCSTHYRIEDTKNFLLSREKDTFEPKKFKDD